MLPVEAIPGQPETDESEMRQGVCEKYLFPMVPNEVPMLPNGSMWVCGAWLRTKNPVVVSRRAGELYTC